MILNRAYSYIPSAKIHAIRGCLCLKRSDAEQEKRAIKVTAIYIMLGNLGKRSRSTAASLDYAWPAISDCKAKVQST
jgi:hypothetical protein